MIDTQTKFYCAKEVAGILRVSVGTVRALIEDGSLDAVNVSPINRSRQHYRIPTESVERLIQKRSEPVTPQKRYYTKH